VWSNIIYYIGPIYTIHMNDMNADALRAHVMGHGSSLGGSSGIQAIDLVDQCSLKSIKDQLNGHDWNWTSSCVVFTGENPNPMLWYQK